MSGGVESGEGTVVDSRKCTKYILVSGGVISGIGKGVITSSIGTLLKAMGLQVTAIKIDPYLNIDAGTFSPYEHGEVFVLDDGGEVDLDLGNYERFLDVILHRDNNITTGKIYQHIIKKERNGDYLGKTVQVVPHVTDEIQEWVTRVAQMPVPRKATPTSRKEVAAPDVCIIELGGTIGDIESMHFIEAFRQFQFKVGHDSFANIHVSLVPQPNSTGEQKTKPTQNSVRQLRGYGLSPDLIVCRSQTPIAEYVKDKISNFCHVPPSQVVAVHDLSSIYRVPLLLHRQGVGEFLVQRLKLSCSADSLCLRKWKNLADRYDGYNQDSHNKVKIALVGKYTKLSDSYTSVIKALRHAALACRLGLDLVCVEADMLEEKTKENDTAGYHEAWTTVCRAKGIIVPGGFGSRGTEGKILAAKYARTKKIPYLGVCLGMQLAVIEFARNVLHWEDAHSTEFNPDTTHPVVIEMPEHNPGQMGATMRLGKRETVFKSKNSLLRKLYSTTSDDDNPNSVEERHRHRYEVNPKYVEDIQKAGLHFVGHSTDNTRMEICELPEHPYFVGVQYHPEYLTRPLCPSPPYLGLLLASSGKLQDWLSRGYRLSPRASYDYDSDDDEVSQAFSKSKESSEIALESADSDDTVLPSIS